MDFTQRELKIIRASSINDIVPAGDRLLRITTIDTVTDQVGGFIMGCEWFARCDRDASYLIPHPILGYVPTCVRCAATSL